MALVGCSDLLLLVPILGMLAWFGFDLPEQIIVYLNTG